MIERVANPQPGDRLIMHPNGLVTIVARTDADTGRITLSYRNERDRTIGVDTGWPGVPWDLWPLDPHEAPPPPELGSRWRHDTGALVEVVATDGVGNDATVTTSRSPSRCNIVVFYGTHDPR